MIKVGGCSDFRAASLSGFPLENCPSFGGEAFKVTAAEYNIMKSRKDDYEEVVKDLEELRRDPKKWEEFMSTQAEKALRHWPGRRTR